jgi:REP element-mobilizing transposase RayT
MHAVWTLPPDDSDYSSRWKEIKIAFAKALPKTERLSAVRAAKANAVSGNGGFGNTRSATTGTMPRMWITSTSTL